VASVLPELLKAAVTYSALRLSVSAAATPELPSRANHFSLGEHRWGKRFPLCCSGSAESVGTTGGHSRNAPRAESIRLWLGLFESRTEEGGGWHLGRGQAGWRRRGGAGSLRLQFCRGRANGL